MLTEINNNSCSYGKYYKEIINLVESNKYSADKLIVLYKDLQEHIKELAKTKEIYTSIGEKNNIMNIGINNYEAIIEEKKSYL